MSVTTTRRTELYDHKKPPKKPRDTSLNDADRGSVCPMTRKRCMADRCVIWDDESNTCTLHPANLYNKIREGVTDAVIVVAQSYKEARHG